MKIFINLLLLFVFISCQKNHDVESNREPSNANTFYSMMSDLSKDEQNGREIWYKATGGNQFFYTYSIQNRIGTFLDWFNVLDTRQRKSRFDDWGMINDPECCVPGSNGCPAKSYDETFGFDWCPGDEVLLKSVGKNDYRDPSCDLVDETMPDKREDPCGLEFGTSAGALGFRKFPNPKFDPATWERYTENGFEWYGTKALGADKKTREMAQAKRLERLQDMSIEPPFRVGIACASCHVAFDPVNPPADPNHPKWQNIKGLVGNQYVRISEIIGSGMPKSSVEWQLFTHTRPGTVDTSALPTDNINNPGSVNPVFNVNARPQFKDKLVKRWRDIDSCDGKKDEDCFCLKNSTKRCYYQNPKGEKETVFHILKGGEDDIGPIGAVQRVYVNIGTCAEKCWLNNLSNFKVFGHDQRNYNQTPLNIRQCMEDCKPFRSITDRIDYLYKFFITSREINYSQAVGMEDDSDQYRDFIVKKYIPKKSQDYIAKTYPGEHPLDIGAKIYSNRCANCHSSQNNISEKTDFKKLSTDASDLSFVDALSQSMIDDYNTKAQKKPHRVDWLGNDKYTGVDQVGTYRCRALHRNHADTDVWAPYASNDLHNRREVKVPGERNIVKGTGHYRNPSLLSIWMHAPFMHNNAIGPEICGKPKDELRDLYVSTYQNSKSSKIQSNPEGDETDCWKYDVSIDGRVKLFMASMDMLLNPNEREPKITTVYEDVYFNLGPKLNFGSGTARGVTLRFPKGTSTSLLGSFLYKEYFDDLFLAEKSKSEFLSRMKNHYKVPSDTAYKHYELMKKALKHVIFNTGKAYLDVNEEAFKMYMKFYSSCNDVVENKGHTFGSDLEPELKDALKAFVLTL